MTATTRNLMGDGYTVGKTDAGRTVYTSADGRFRVRATGAKRGSGYSPWCVERGESRYYASSLKDAAGLIGRLRVA